MAFWDDISRWAGNLTGGFIGESDEERRRKRQQAQQKAQQAAKVNTFRGDRTYTPRNTDTISFNNNRQQLNRGLDQGKSYEDMSRSLGLSVEAIRDYTDTTRPGYGVEAKPAEPVKPNNNKLELEQFKTPQQKQREQGIVRFEDRLYKPNGDGTYSDQDGNKRSAEVVGKLGNIEAKFSDREKEIANEGVTPWNVGKEVLEAAQDVVLRPLARIPETVHRSLLLEPLVGNAGKPAEDATSTASDENTGLREFFYGKDPIKSYQEQGRDLEIAGKNSGNLDLEALSGFAPFVAPALAALDLSPFAALKAARSAKLAEEGAVDLTAFSQFANKATDDAIQNVERQAGRKLTNVEKNQIADEVDKKIRDEVMPKKSAPSNSTESIEEQSTNTNLLDEQDAPRLPEVGEDPTIPSSAGPDEPPRGASVEAGPGLYEDRSLFREAREEVENSRNGNAAQNMYDDVQSQVYDPLSVAQRYDNQLYGTMKKNGEILPGQRELLPHQSMTQTIQRINNPEDAAGVLTGKKYVVNGKQLSVDDVNKKYGKSSGSKAQEFEDYRIFRDQLERIHLGEKNSLPVDPQAMQNYIDMMDRKYPDMIDDAAVLRKFEGELFKGKVDAGIDSPEFYENSLKYNFFNPRAKTTPDELIQPKVSNSMGKTTKVTEGRVKDAQGQVVSSPMQLFYDHAKEYVQSTASKDLDNIFEMQARNPADNGFKLRVDADRAYQHRQAASKLEKLSDDVLRMEQGVKGAKKNVKLAKNYEQAKKEAVKFVRDRLKSASDDDIFADLRGVELTDDEALELVKTMHSASSKGSARIINKLSKTKNISKADAKKMLEDARGNLKATREAKSDEYRSFLDTTQYSKTGLQTRSYRSKGETGKIELPVDIARMLAKNAETRNLSLMEKGFRQAGNIQKTALTGTLAPAFKAKQALIDNNYLMYHNGESLSAFRPKAMARGVQYLFYPKGAKQMTDELKMNGFRLENALQTRRIDRSVADDIAARAGVKEFFARNPKATARDILGGVSNLIARVNNAQRVQVAQGAYQKLRAKGWSHEDAIKYAANAPDRVFGDMSRVSQLAQDLEAAIPYTSATQAGLRSTMRRYKVATGETIAKDLVFVSSIAGITAYSLANSQEYYKDAIRDKRQYELDSNVIIATPFATKNKNGEWTGVIKIPIPPDARPAHRAIWKTVYDMTNGKGPDPATVAGNMFAQVTGDMPNNFYDPQNTNNGKNSSNGVLSQSPILNATKVIAGVDPRTGETLGDEYMRSKPKTDQYYEKTATSKGTSQAAKDLSKALNGFISPLQADKLFGLAGQFGKQVKNDEGFDFGEMVDPRKYLTTGKSQTSDQVKTRKYFEDITTIAAELAAAGDKKTYQDFLALHAPKSKDQKKNMLNNAVKMNQFMDYQGDGTFTTTKLFDVEKKLDAKARKRGEPGNPIYDLSPQQLQKVLMYRGNKANNAAKQNYSKNGMPAFVALGLDKRWYNEFTKKESKYYQKVLKEGDDEFRTFSGKKKPRLTAKQEAVQNQYFDLKDKGDDAGAKALLAGNKWLIDSWSAGNDFTNEERKALGFLADYDNDDPRSSNYYKSYGGKGGWRRGGRGGSSDGSDGPNTGVAGTLTHFGNESAGMTQVKGPQQELVNVRTVVKQPRRATKKPNIRITI